MKYSVLLTRRSLFIALALLFSVAFAVTMWMAFYTPIYEDEMAWKIFSNRLFVDQGKLIYLFAQCNRGYLLDMPLTWFPMQWLDSVIYGNASNPALMRILGWIWFIVLVVCWASMLRMTSKLSTPSCILFVTAFFSFGVTPFAMVLNRPEQPLLIWLTVALLLTFWHDRHPLKTYVGKTIVTGFFALLICLIGATHPKGLFLFPLIAFVWWRCVKWWPASFPLFGVMIWTALETKQIWFLRTGCEEYPGLSTMLQNLTLRPNQIWLEPAEFMRDALTNLLNATQYISQMQFDTQYISDWLPPAGELFKRLPNVWVSQILIWLPIVVVFILMIINVAESTRQSLYARSQSKVTSKRRLPARWAIALLLSFSLLVIMGFQTAKNFYESSFIWPLILLIAIFSFQHAQQALGQKFVRWVLPILLIAAIISGYFRFELFFQPALQWQSERHHDWQAEQKSLQSFAKNQCDITPDTKNLVLGFSNYGAFWQHQLPILLTYSAGWWGIEANFAQTMSKRQAGGLVAECKDLPKETQAFAKQQGHYCCVSGANLRNLVNIQVNQK